MHFLATRISSDHVSRHNEAGDGVVTKTAGAHNVKAGAGSSSVMPENVVLVDLRRVTTPSTPR
jgi:hypothetical protein